MSPALWLSNPAPDYIPSDFRMPTPPSKVWGIIRRNIGSLLIAILTAVFWTKATSLEKDSVSPKENFEKNPSIWSLCSLFWLPEVTCAQRSSQEASITLSPRAGGFQLPFFLKLLNLFSNGTVVMWNPIFFNNCRGTLLAGRFGRRGWNLPCVGPDLAITTPPNSTTP